MLADFLQGNGYEVLCQYDGLHVLDCIQEHQIDLILLDIMLPYRSGDTILADIRKFSTVPVIVISAKETTQNKIDLLRLGADDYITKPFDMVMSLTTCDEQWKWGKYAISLPVSKTQIVKSRYAFALILSLVGFAVALGVNTISFICFPAYRFGFYVFLSIASLGVTLLFLSFILPSNYSLGVNAGFAAMIIMVILLIILGIWSKLTNNAIMWFVVEHFELSMVITFVGVAILFVLSYALSVSFFKRKHT